MVANKIAFIDFAKVDKLLEGFNKTTGFVTAILDLEGNVLSKSGWRQMCTHFHRVHPETAQKCTHSDTELANKMAEGAKYHFYKCHNGLIDVAVPIRINGEHVANLFSGQFFFEKPDVGFFKQQAKKYGFDEAKYLEALEKVPVVTEQEVKTAMDFLLDMTQLISDLGYQKIEQEKQKQLIADMGNRAQALLESIPDLIFVFNQDGFFIDYHTPDDSFLFMPPEAFLNKHISKVLPEQTSQITLAAIEKLFAENKAQTYQYTAQIKGRICYYDARMVKYGADKAYAIVRDITAHRESENKIEEQQRQLSSMVDHLPGFVYRCLNDESWTTLYISDKCKDITGYSSTDFTSEGGITFKKIINKKYHQALADEWKRVLASKTNLEFRYTITTANNEVRWVWERGEGVFDENGELLFLEGYIEDITERRQAKEKLRDAQANLSAIVENTSDNIWSVNTKYELVYINQVFKDSFLDSTGAIIETGMNILSVAPEIKRKEWKQYYDRVLDGERLVFIETIETNGSNIYIEIAANPIKQGEKIIGASLLVVILPIRKKPKKPCLSRNSNTAT
jgi:PAS domain S-box-containing protein